MLIITHSALMQIDHSAADGWTLIIDEDPKIWVSDTLDVGPSRPFWEATYNLTPLKAGYSAIALKADGPSFRAVRRDRVTEAISALHDRIRRGGVVVKLADWADFPSRLTWFSIWDVADLAGYERVIILANSFDHLLTAKLLPHIAPNVVLKPLAITQTRVWAPRDVSINYVTEDHVTGAYHLQHTPEGQMCVSAWCEWVRKIVTPSEHYWCANKKLKVPGDPQKAVPGLRISPKIAGSNEFMKMTQCSILYAAKASTNEVGVLKDIFNDNITFDDIRRDREFEDLIQIVFRSSLRVPDDTRPVTINVYDREQAEFIRDYFETADFPFNISLHRHDIGATKTQQKRGPKPGQSKTAAERAKAYRERKKAQQKLAA